MKRALPLWIATVVPATIAGHALAYALSGRSAGAGHAWMQPALELSLALLAATCVVLVAQALLRAGILVHTSIERSALPLWPRLAVCQLALYTAIELAEGAHPGPGGWAAQIFTSLVAALLLALFASFIVRCARGAEIAARYLQRLFQHVASFVSRRPEARVFALCSCTGTARFQRPPPHG